MHLKLILSAIAFQTLCMSCNKEIKKFEKNIKDGTWVISKFEKNGDDLTAMYENYIFDFNENSILNVASSEVSIQGTWVYGDFFTALHISNLSSPLEELNHKFNSQDYNANEIILSGHDGENERKLVFQKE
jgi:hypothetical protein